MSKYVDLVVAGSPAYDGQFLVTAPAWSGLAKSDEVVIDTVRGAFPAVVNGVITIDMERDTEILSLLLLLTKEDLPLKRVLSKVEYRKFEYEEENHDTV